MNHWFDRLAVRTAEDEREARLTRRETMKAAAGGAIAVGALGSPLLSKALAESRCECIRSAVNRHNQFISDQVDKLIRESLVGGAGVISFLAGYTAAQFVTSYNIEKCGGGTGCGGKIGQAPPPKDQPCLGRGGFVLHDQCGGSGGGGAQQCPGGTHLCTTGLCCFGSDLCCANCAGGAQCCIAEIGCTCC
jgi:hypothetical protein